MVGHFFLSYSSVDRDFADTLDRRLTAEASPFSVWMDRHEAQEGERYGENRLRVGEDWDDQIVEVLRSCQGLIFIMTPDSVESHSICKKEWSRALKYKKPVIPLLYDRDAEVPLRLEDRHYIDFTGDFESAFAELCAHLRWLPSPAGLLQQKKEWLQDRKREVRRESDAHRSRQLEEEIVELGAEIARLTEIVNNPQAAAERVENSIARGLERERQPKTPATVLARNKFINSPPVAAPTYFQDRFIESKLIGQFLNDDSKRLLYVVGRGGVGKTALVCRLLKALERGELPDGRGPLVVDGIVYLSAIGSRRISTANMFADLIKLLPAGTAEELERLYKSPQLDTATKLEALLAAFPTDRVVLLLDNFEDLVETQNRKLIDEELREALETVLTSPTHTVKVIVTTRYAPTDLALIRPERQQRVDLDEGLPSPFAENILREMDVDGKAGLKAAPDSLLTKARERTRGIPRALEHLFAILTNDRDTSLAELLESTQQLLPEQVMEVLVGEAFNRLDITSQQVMQSLSIYGTPVSSVAVDFLLQPFVPGIDSAPVLKRLVNMQLVRKQEGRYYLHPIDRQYALSRIPEGVDTDRAGAEDPRYTRIALLHGGANYFRQIRTRPENWKTIEDLAPQLAEFDLRCEAHDYETAASVLLAIDFNYLYVWGFYRLMADLHARLRDRLEDLNLRAASIGNQGTALRVMGKVPEATACYEVALEITRSQQNLLDESVWLSNLANCYQDLGQTAKAIEFNEQSLAIKRQVGFRSGEAINLGSLGNCYGDLGETEKSLDFHRQALVLAREYEEHISEGLILSNLSDVLTDAGRFAEAIRYAKEGLSIGAKFAAPMVCAYNLENLALGNLYLGDLAAARAAVEEGRQYDVPEISYLCLGLLGVIALRQGEQTAAKEAFTESLTQAARLVRNSPGYYQAQDSKGICLSGLTLSGDGDHVAEAIKAFQAARTITQDKGIAGRVLRLFDTLALSDDNGRLTAVRKAIRHVSHS